MRRLVVVGAGAVGASIGGLCFAARFPVVLIARGAHLDALCERGLSLRLPELAFQLDVPVAESVAEVDWQPGDVALLATKLQDAEQALDALLAAAGAKVPVVCAVNGIDGEVWAAERFETVLATLVWLPATHLMPGEVRLHSAGARGVLDTGAVRGSAGVADEICTLFRRAGFEALRRDEILRWKRAKLLTNLGAAAQALVTDDWLAVAAAARAEGTHVLADAGLEHVPVEELLERCACVGEAPIGGVAREGGSTWQSRARGLPLESPWIEGAIARIAGEHGLEAPINAALARAALAPRDRRAAEFLPG
ncbi:2-dehydropantoate 2-reductase [Planctomycetes bacterium Pla86]|uniref:2-dehydropantoate 2-reductase n=1 Tax=Engelhardtia mirabilis TaxID=2528011 RepID=A0A518BR97_9BACT|nr:2-dehydropantoate 2-reductase [Planctomycetes bacterium Pla133]QDV03831.1 2-dehydropantoate 2-reductase [Planctomycetes bacterium Pla86]